MNYRVPVLCCLLLCPTATPVLATLPTSFQDEVIVSGLDLPTSFDFLPDGRILITEKISGKVRLLVNGTLSPTPVLTLTDVNSDGWERGLLGIAVDPAWPTRPYIYLHYDRLTTNTINLARFKGTGDLNNWGSANLAFGNRYNILVDIPDQNESHNGGTLRFDKNGLLYESIGDDSTPCAAQDSSDFRGKILRLAVSGLPDLGSGPPTKLAITPTQHPFPNTNPNAGLVYCRGLRNPFRFQIDPDTGHLLIGDVGLDSYEELDEGRGGENFGWPFREGPAIQTFAPCQEPGGSGTQTYTGYIATYDRTQAPSAAIVAGPRYWRVHSALNAFPPEYNGAVFYTDYYYGFIRVIQRVGDAWLPMPPVPGQPNATDWATGMDEIVEMREGPDGALYVLDLFPGSLHRIVFTGSVSGVEQVGAPRPGLRVHPNPFRPALGHLAVEGETAGGLEIVAANGSIVAKLATPAWDGRDMAGRLVSPGLYFVRRRGGDARGAGSKVLVLP
jgi:glucose/arabinose dehydrogenase